MHVSVEMRMEWNLITHVAALPAGIEGC